MLILKVTELFHKAVRMMAINQCDRPINIRVRRCGDLTNQFIPRQIAKHCGPVWIAAPADQFVEVFWQISTERNPNAY